MEIIMKRILCTLLCALIISGVFAAMPLTAGAETQFTYTVENGEATITGCSGSPTEIVIPAEIDGNPVTAIGKNAFFDNDDIEKVYLTEYIQLIDDNAFGDCSSLTYVAFYEGLNIIGEGAFECCENLNNVELPGTLFQIGDSAFSTCRALTDVELSQGLLTIGKYAFYECTSLKSITVPESVRTIDDYAIAYFFTGSSMGIISDFVIYGWDNSAASKYASDRNITFDYAGQDTALVEIKANEGKRIENRLMYGEVHGLKKDDTGAPLAGAVIGLFKPETTEFTTGTAILTAISAEDGGFSFAKVPYGLHPISNRPCQEPDYS